MMVFRQCITLLLIFILWSCQRRLEILPISHQKAGIMINSRERPEGWRSPCRNPYNYLPDTIHRDWFAPKKVKIAWHIVDDSLWQKNLTPETGEAFFFVATEDANNRLKNNFKMALPLGNQTPVYDPYFRWVVTPTLGYANNGYFFHTDDSLVYFNNKGRFRTDYSNREIEKFGVSKDTISNIFVIPVHPDSAVSKTFKITGIGIALGNHVKLGGVFQGKKNPWDIGTLINHELGHVFGLSHSWYEDGCDDTPTHANCWNYSDKPPCDKNVSNNVMDYNSQQMAWSPCQIGKVHMKMSDTLVPQRKLVVRDWCTPDTQSYIVISDTIQWLGYKDSNKSIIIEKGGVLHLCCRLGMARGTYIYVKPGGKLELEEVTLHNDCDHQWKGIVIGVDGEEKGQIIKTGKVTIADVQEDPDLVNRLLQLEKRKQ